MWDSASSSGTYILRCLHTTWESTLSLSPVSGAQLICLIWDALLQFSWLVTTSTAVYKLYRSVEMSLIHKGASNITVQMTKINWVKVLKVNQLTRSLIQFPEYVYVILLEDSVGHRTYLHEFGRYDIGLKGDKYISGLATTEHLKWQCTANFIYRR